MPLIITKSLAGFVNQNFNNSKNDIFVYTQAVTGGQKQEDKERVLWVKFEEADINGKRSVKNDIIMT